MTSKKKFWTSKTLWLLGLGFVAAVVQEATGEQLFSPELQAALIAGVGIILRMVTKEALDWSL